MNRTNPKNLSGMTLAELLVAATIVGIVMVGMVSVDYAIRSTQQSAVETSLASMSTSATIMQISRDATAAVGDNSNRGIDPATGNALCIRKNEDAAGNPQDVTTYADDTWFCYWRSGNNIHYCPRTAGLGPGSCLTTDPVVGTAACTNYSPCSTYAFTYTFTIDQPAQIIRLQVSLTNRSDNTTPPHAITNPETTLSTSIYPQGHGF